MGKRKARRAKTQVPRKNAESVNGEYGWIEPGLRGLAVPVAGLTEDAGNARTHNERNLAAIRRSLEGFRQQKPLVVDADGVVVAGNGTLQAARALGWSHVAAVRTTLRGDEARAYALADNRTAELAAWDEDKLAAVLGEIKAADIDLMLTGFSDREAAQRLKDLNPPAIEPHFSVVIECASESEQRELYERCIAEGRRCRLLML